MLARGNLHGGPTTSLRAAGRQGSLGSRLGTRRRSTVCLMGAYQFKRRADRLKQRGVQVHDFGTRVLQEQCYGEDVISLQAFLGEQGYLNAMDGLTGYFGNVTKEALMSWQRDNGLPVTGVFNQDCKWAYLKQQEARAAEAAAAPVWVTLGSQQAPSPTPLTLVPVWQVWMGAAALAAAAAFAASRLNAPGRRSGRAGQRSNLLAGAVQVLRRFLHTATGAATMALAWTAKAVLWTLKLAAGAAAATLVAGVAVVRAVVGIAVATLLWTVAAVRDIFRRVRAWAVQLRVQEEEEEELALAGDLAWEGAAAREVLYDEEYEQQVAYAAEAGSAPYAAGARMGYMSDDEEQEEDAWGGTAVPLPAQASRQAQPAGRLSDAELEKYISGMKGEAPRRTMPVQKPGPRPLADPQPQPGGDRFLNSKYGKYYGGRQVLDQVKGFLDDRGRGPAPNSGPAKRMQALGYPMRDSRPGARKAARQSRANPTPAPAAAAGQPGVAVPAPAPAPTPTASASRARVTAAASTAAPTAKPAVPSRPFNPRAAPPPPPAFQDVASEPVSLASSMRLSPLFGAPPPPTSLLAGTELAALPEAPTKPVNVHRPSSNGGMPGSTYNAAPAVAAAAAAAPAQQAPPRAPPVPVIKGPVTVGELMRLSQEDQEDSEDLAQRSLPPALDRSAAAGAPARVPVVKPTRLAAKGRGEVMEGAEDAELAQQR